MDAHEPHAPAPEQDDATDRAFIIAQINDWEDGATAPHDALTAIRDRLTPPKRGPR